MSTFAANVVTRSSVAVAAPHDSQVNGIRLGAARLDSIATTSCMSGGATDLANGVDQAIQHGGQSITLACLTENVAGTSTITLGSKAHRSEPAAHATLVRRCASPRSQARRSEKDGPHQSAVLPIVASCSCRKWEMKWW
jgi:hypothetical protein